MLFLFKIGDGIKSTQTLLKTHTLETVGVRELEFLGFSYCFIDFCPFLRALKLFEEILKNIKFSADVLLHAYFLQKKKKVRWYYFIFHPEILLENAKMFSGT